VSGGDLKDKVYKSLAPPAGNAQENVVLASGWLHWPVIAPRAADVDAQWHSWWERYKSSLGKVTSIRFCFLFALETHVYILLTIFSEND
jgi:hypothetical protein